MSFFKRGGGKPEEKADPAPSEKREQGGEGKRQNAFLRPFSEKKLFLPLFALFLLFAAFFFLSRLLSPEKREEGAERERRGILYIADGGLYYYSGGKPVILTEKALNHRTITDYNEYYTPLYRAEYTEDGKAILFYEEFDGKGGKLCVRGLSPSEGKGETRRIADSVTDFGILKGEKLWYRSGKELFFGSYRGEMEKLCEDAAEQFFSEDGSELIYADSEGKLYRLSTESGAERRKVGENFAEALSYNGSLDRFFYADGKGALYFLEGERTVKIEVDAKEARGQSGGEGILFLRSGDFDYSRFFDFSGLTEEQERKLRREMKEGGGGENGFGDLFRSDGRKESLLASSVILDEAELEGGTEKTGKALLAIPLSEIKMQKIRLSELPSSTNWGKALNDSFQEGASLTIKAQLYYDGRALGSLDYRPKAEYILDPDNKRLFEMSSAEGKTNLSLFQIRGGHIGDAERIERGASQIRGVFLSGKDFYYIRDLDEKGMGTLCRNGERIAEHVDNIGFYRGKTYINSGIEREGTRSSSTFSVLEGERIHEISEEVVDWNVYGAGRIVLGKNYKKKKDCFDLYEVEEKRETLIQENVQSAQSK